MFDKTVIVYMMAENSLSTYTQGDLNEMIEASDSIPNNCRLIVYLDKSESLQPELFEIRKKVATGVKTYPEQNSCDGTVFRTVLSDIAKEYPSNAYSLVMWSHGSGWIPAKGTTSASKSSNKSIGIDNNENTTSNTGSEMDIATMRQSIEQSGLHFDCILFDACFMQGVEVAYELRNCADYIIGSPAEIPAYGAPYHILMNEFFYKDEYASATGIATDYYKYYKNNDGLVISVIKSAELENLARVTASYLPEPLDIDLYPNAQKYAPWSFRSNWFPDYTDMASLMNKALEESAYNAWVSQLQKTVPVRLFTKSWVSEYSYSFYPMIIDADHIAAVSMFQPTEKYTSMGYNTAVKQTQWWKDVFGE